MGAVFYVAYNLFFYLLSPHFPPYSTFFYPCLCPLLFLPLANLLRPFLLLQAAEGRQEELTQRGATEKRELELRIEEMEEKEQVLQARIEALQADNDFTNERLAALQGTNTRAHTSIHVALHRLGRLIQSYSCVNQSLIPKCNKSNWTATSHSGAQS